MKEYKHKDITGLTIGAAGIEVGLLVNFGRSVDVRRKILENTIK